jgi:alkylation response protein AidB-like acyl-CoA dehydrogenase
MELEFTPDQDDLRDSIRAVLHKESPVSLARAVVERAERPEALWSTMVDLGWPALTIPEDDGGIGLGMLELAILAEELGRVIAPGPLLPTLSQFAPAVREAGTPAQQREFLGAVAAGELTGSLAISEASGSYDPAEATATMTLDGDDVVLAGTKTYVIEGDAVDELVVVCRAAGTNDGEGVRAVVVPVTATSTTPVDTFDGSRRVAHVTLEGVRVSRDRVLGDPNRSALEPLRRAIQEATVSLALEMVGTAQTIFDTTLDYAKHREQFGVLIGTFQAIKHKFADMLVSLERARSLGYFAALTIAEDDPRRANATSVAKAAAGDCQRLLAKEGIQILGGIGYTWEHDMQLYVKRIKSGDPMFGGGAWHRARIAEDLLGV